MLSTSNSNYFAIGPYRPNMRCVRKGRINHQRTMIYLQKTGDFWGTMEEGVYEESDDVYYEAMEAGTAEESVRILKDGAPREFFVSHILETYQVIEDMVERLRIVSRQIDRPLPIIMSPPMPRPPRLPDPTRPYNHQ
jgi:hypothetical protein